MSGGESNTERPGGWVDGIGWVALLHDLPRTTSGTTEFKVGPDEAENYYDPLVWGPGKCWDTPVIVVRWPDGTAPVPPSLTPPQDRESLGRLVREVWIEWALEQQNPKPSWLVPWEGLSEPDREVDRRIGERLAAAAPSLTPEAGEASGANMIAAERQRQIDAEGWTPQHDAEHVDGSIALAAAAYAVVAAETQGGGPYSLPPTLAEGQLWPWDVEWWKPSDDPTRNLARAGALIAAEIDRIEAAS